jgi:hypothetical protein
MNREQWIGRLSIFALGGGAMAYIALTDPPRLPVGTADGFYVNACCGSFRLQNGQISSDHRYMNYVIETDKGGAYVLPSRYVGVRNGNVLEFDRGRGPLKLRLDDQQHPRQVELYGRDGTVFAFTRSGAGVH